MYTREKYRYVANATANATVDTERLRLFDYVSEVLELEDAKYLQVPTEFLSTEYLLVLEIPEHLGAIPNPYALGQGVRSLEDYPKVQGTWVQPDKFVFDTAFTGKLQLLRKTALDRPVQAPTELLSAASLDRNFQQCLHITQELIGGASQVAAPVIWVPPELPKWKPSLDVLLVPEYIVQRANWLARAGDWHIEDYAEKHLELNSQLQLIFNAALAELREYFDVRLIEPLRDVYYSNVGALSGAYREVFVDIGDPPAVGAAGTLDGLPLMYFNGTPAQQLKQGAGVRAYPDRPRIFSTQRCHPEIGDYIDYYSEDLSVLVQRATDSGTARGYTTLPNTRVPISMTGGLCFLGSTAPPGTYVQRDNATVPVLVPTGSGTKNLETHGMYEKGLGYTVEYTVFTDDGAKTYNKVPLLETGYIGEMFTGGSYDTDLVLWNHPKNSDAWYEFRAQETITAFYGRITGVYRRLSDAVGRQISWVGNPAGRVRLGITAAAGMGVPAVSRTEGPDPNKKWLKVLTQEPVNYLSYPTNPVTHGSYYLPSFSLNTGSGGVYAITARNFTSRPIENPERIYYYTFEVIPELEDISWSRVPTKLPDGEGRTREMNDWGGLTAYVEKDSPYEVLDVPALVQNRSAFAAWRIQGAVATYWNPRTAGLVGDDLWQQAPND